MAINVKKSRCLRIDARRDKLCSSIHIRWMIENLTGLMKSAILVYILCVATNSNVLSAKPNRFSTEQLMAFLSKLVD